MGRHTKLTEGDAAADADEEHRPERRPARSWSRMLVSVPLLPMVALVVAIGVVSYAWGTSQISLNFAGGPPQQAQADSSDSTVGRGRAADPQRTGVLISFQVARRTETGYTGTVTIANRTGKPVERWRLGFKFADARVLSVRNAVVESKGQVTWLRNRAAAPAIAPGATVRITYTAAGTPARPTVCKFNDAACTLG
ncbi:cellulose binding domain-containing protein [Thermomonospora cellulosilytica]|uniref:CBM2 domain-containing protein n=1 Tax=Thermomonospora cellulosilytica TaxID=1411118 RepID=A0A7W3N3Z1_9ACTN|nr:cellulose binding domain-containing protein [Thermomonospora cellulosilytica]MBA9007133.1 hypothetical protein [Thermomonospora cellulosilytica]